MSQVHFSLDDVDRRIIQATQGGLPLVPAPYHAVAEQLDLDPETVMARLRRMVEAGVVRRVGLVPNHYALGVTAKGMSVWDVRDVDIQRVGKQVGALEFVSHCYHRPRTPPGWPYNLFAMVHGRDRHEVERKVTTIAELLGSMQRGHEVLYSTRILKKTGLRIAA